MKLLWRRAVRALPLFALALVIVTKLDDWVTEAWFFEELGYEAVYGRMMLARAVLFLAGASWCALWLWFNLRHARRVAAATQQTPVRRLIPLRDKRTLDRYRRWWAGAVLGLLVLLAGSYAATHWLVLWRCMVAAPTGQSDPVFGRDIAFFLFQLPALNFLWMFVWGTLWVSLLAVAAFYAYEEVWQTRGRELAVAHGGTRHLALLGVLLLCWKALGYRLSAWNLITARGEPWGGLGYTALYGRLLLIWPLALLALGAAFFLWRAARRGTAHEARQVLLLWLAINLTCGTIAPLLMEKLYTAPRRAMLEAPIVELRRDATRAAFALREVRNWPQKPADDMTLRRATNLVPQWTPEILRARLNDTRQRGEEFRCSTPHFDSYFIGGAWRAVFVTAREARDGGHGHDLIFCDATKLSPDGQPLIYEAQRFPELRTVLPEIIFGSGETAQTAFDAARAQRALPDVMRPHVWEKTGPQAIKLDQSYQGRGGVPLDSWTRRLLLAWRFSDSRLLGAEVKRLAWHQNAAERCSQIAPFLIFSEPQPVLAQNRIFWLVPGHSVADSYPLSFAPGQSKLNYLRESVVALVDAYDGSVQLFKLDESDPLLAAYDRLFPELFQPLNSLPTEIRNHLSISPLQFAAWSDLWGRVLAPTTEDVIDRSVLEMASLRQIGFWNAPQDYPLPPTTFLAVDFNNDPNSGATQNKMSQNKPPQRNVLQLLSPTAAERSDALSTPITGALIAAREGNRTFLWHWQAAQPVSLPWPKEHGALSLNGALVGNDLLARGVIFPPSPGAPHPFWFSAQAGYQASLPALLGGGKQKLTDLSGLTIVPSGTQTDVSR